MYSLWGKAVSLTTGLVVNGDVERDIFPLLGEGQRHRNRHALFIDHELLL
jgi:hypothetical protein